MSRAALATQATQADREALRYIDAVVKWAQLLENNLYWRRQAALMLVRLGYQPDQLPRLYLDFPRLDPRVYLFSLAGLTLAHKAHILNGALLSWAGVFSLTEELDPDQAAAYLGEATRAEIEMLIRSCDLAAFVRRPGYNLTPAAIRARYDSAGYVIDREALRRMFKRYQGGQFIP